MADQNLFEGSSTSSMHSEMADSSMEINIKTLDSQIYRFNADKDMQVSAFKEKIASQIGVPMEQQRLIFRGKVLKDTHLLSEYHLETGDTLHLVARQPSQAQPSSSSSTGDATTNNSGMGAEPGLGAPRGRIGQISHSVVVGTFNAGEQGEGGPPPDFNRVIGAVLNSMGLGNPAGMQPNVLFNSHVQNPQRTEMDGRRDGAGSQSQGGNHSQAGNPLSGQFHPQVMQIPLGAAIAIPSFSMPIPDSLHTLCEFMNRMEMALSQRAGNQPSQSSNDSVNIPRVELPSNHGVPSPNALGLVIRQAQRLISGPAMGALSHIAERLEQEAGSSDPSIRGNIQAESVQVGLSMQHLGALLLELGRTILTLRMGQSPVESSVNAGPAVYISPTGPNPIMVQPFPLQTSSLFANPAANMINPVASGPVGVGSIPRHVNIHIHTGAAIAPVVPGVGPRTTTGEATQGEHVGRTVSGDSGQSQALPVRNFSANVVPSGPNVIAVSGTGVDALQPHPPSLSPEIQTFVDNMRSEQLASSGHSESLTIQGQSIGSAAGDDDSVPQNISSRKGVVDTNLSISRMEEHEQAQLKDDKPRPEKDSGMSMKSESEPSSSSNDGGYSKSEKPQLRSQEGASGSPQDMNIPDKSSNVPLGLGLGGLQPKRRGRRPTLQEKSSEGSTVAPSQTQQRRLVGQQVLQSLASLSSGGNSNAHATAGLSHLTETNTPSFPTSLSTGDHNDDGQLDVSDALSQALQSPALNGLLAGVSNQTGIGSPNALRNMLEQMTQSPAMRNTVNQIAQQIDNHDLENMFSGLGGNQGGGFDLSRMVQQMMPIVTQALGGVSTGVPSDPRVGVSGVESGSTREVESFHENSQLEPQDLAQRIERQSSPGGIFSSVVRSVGELYGHDDGEDSQLNELCSDAGLAREFVEMLRHDISQRLQEETGP